jgi:hypothetical protein
VSHERAVYKAIAIVADTKKVVKQMDRDKLAELRAMSKPSLDIEDLMAAIIMICEYKAACSVIVIALAFFQTGFTVMGKFYCHYHDL